MAFPKELPDFRQSSVNPGNIIVTFAPHHSRTTGVSLQVTCHTLYASPFLTGQGGTIQEAKIRLITGIGSATVRVALYHHGRPLTEGSSGNPNDLYPGVLLLDCGTFATNAGTGPNVTLTIATSYELPTHEMIWVALVAHERPTIRAGTVASEFPFFGFDEANFANGRHGFTVTTFSYDAPFPTTFPTSSTFQAVNDDHPIVGFGLVVP